MGPSIELRISRVPSLAFLSIALLALSACAESGEDKTETGGDSGQSGDAPVEVKFTLSEFKVDAEQTVFQTGVPYRFVLKNEGVIAHDFRITELGEAEAMAGMHVPGEEHAHGTELMLVHEADLPPGATFEQEITFLRPGEFEIACHVAGHLQAGMHIPITVEGDLLAEATPIDPASITFDSESMRDMPCHAMGTTIMGDCSEEDIERIRAEILEGRAGASTMRGPATMGSDSMGEEDHALGADDEHGHGDAMMPGDEMPGGSMMGDMMDGMKSDEMMAEMMAGMAAEGMMSEEMMARMMDQMNSGEMANRMRQRIVFDLSSRRDEACQVVEPNTIVGACTPEEVARLVEEIMRSMADEVDALATAVPDDDHSHEEGTEEAGDHDDSSGG